MKFILFLCILLGASLHVGFSAEPFIAEPPAHVVAIQGDTILLRCAVGDQITATLSWQDIDTGNFLTKGPGVDPEENFQKSTRSRISIIGDRANGEYHLQIRDVVGDDGGRYACYYYDAFTLDDVYSNIVTLTVMTPPSKGYPLCTMEPEFSRIGVGDNVTLICESRGGNPPAALTWIRNRDILNQHYTPSNARPVNRYQLILTEHDMDVRYVCLARNPATKQPISCSVKPLRSRIGVRIQPSTLKAEPGNAAVFNCVSEDIPGIVYRWYVNDRLVDGSHRRYSTKRGGVRLKIYPVIPSDDFSLVTCAVEQPTVDYDLSGTATALFWVNRDANPDFVWETTQAPIPTTPVYNRLPDFIYNNIDITEKVPSTDEITTTTAPIGTTKPIGIHEGSSRGGGLVDTDGITIDVNDLLETLIDPELIEPVIPERELTAEPLETTTKEIIQTTNPTSSPTTVARTTESQDNNKLCRGDTCVAITTESTLTTNATQNSTKSEPSNEIADLVTPPHEKATVYKGQNDVPISSEQKSSRGTAIGLSLGLIFLTILVLIIAFIIWRNRSAKQNEDKEKQKPKPTKK